VPCSSHEQHLSAAAQAGNRAGGHHRDQPQRRIAPMNSTPARVTTALMAVADTAAAASRAVEEGADLIDLTGAPPAEVAAFRRSHPGVPVCADDGAAGLTRDRAAAADDGAADLTRDPAAAARNGARLICASQQQATQSGLPPERLLLETPPAGLMTALATGYPVLVDLPDSPSGVQVPGDAAPGGGALAAAALSGWLGAAVVRTRHPRPVRRALDLTDSVRGVRPPARTVRGLA
jgi:dihydropteroate synthase